MRERVISSEEERFPDTEEVTSSILVSPTMFFMGHLKKVLFFCTLNFLNAFSSGRYNRKKGGEKMIAGIGIDLCSVERIENACRSEAFCKRVFTPEELAFANEKKSRGLHLAGAFAAKEAFAKASGLGVARIGLQNVSVAHDDGRPFLRVNFKITELAKFRDAKLYLSISHDDGIAAAVVLIETEGA